MTTRKSGAVMRTSILGILDYDNLERVVENTIRIAKVPFAVFPTNITLLHLIFR